MVQLQLVVIVKFIHLQVQELLQFLLAGALTSANNQVSYMVVAGGGGGGGAAQSRGGGGGGGFRE